MQNTLDVVSTIVHCHILSATMATTITTATITTTTTYISLLPCSVNILLIELDFVEDLTSRPNTCENKNFYFTPEKIPSQLIFFTQNLTFDKPQQEFYGNEMIILAVVMCSSGFVFMLVLLVLDNF